MTHSPKTQTGMVLLSALIMLLLVTIMGVVSANNVQSNLAVVQNVEARNAVRNAALSAIQEALHWEQTTEEFLTKVRAFQVGCPDGFTRCYDLSGGSGSDDIIVVLTEPQCISSSPISNIELNVLTNAGDASCYQPGQFSLCSSALWEITAIATDSVTGAKVEVRQGIQKRTLASLVTSLCDVP